MIKNARELKIELDMLNGNINRMCVCESNTELLKMVATATTRLAEIAKYRNEMLSKKSENVIKLPCSVGDVFALDDDEPDDPHKTVVGIECDEEGDWYIWYRSDDHSEILALTLQEFNDCAIIIESSID